MTATTKHFQPFMMAEERAARSVFVGNIPYEATEEQLKEIFCQAGPVVSFRLVYDRETGKPKGYGFCEYQDIETAQSAMRNLNNHDFNGRPLRVGVAAGEQAKDENRAMQQALGGPISESPYGDPIDPDKAPEAISRAVASLPPEQMFELMKQMKLCIQNNPNEARNMLLQNPQLAYALLQAQIVMKIVDPQVALAMLHRQMEQIPPVMPSGNGQALQHQSPITSLSVDTRSGSSAGSRSGGQAAPPIGFASMPNAGSTAGGRQLNRGIHVGDDSGSLADARETAVERQHASFNDRRDLMMIERHSHSMPVKDWQEFQSLPRNSPLDHTGVEHMGVDRADSHLADNHKNLQADVRSSVTLERRETSQVDRRDFGFKSLHGHSLPDMAVLGAQRAGDVKSDVGSSSGTGLHPGAVSGVVQRQDVSTVRTGPGPLAGTRTDLLIGMRQDVGPGSSRSGVREIDSVTASRMDSIPDMRDPRQVAEMRRTVVGQGSVPRMTMSGTSSSVASTTAVSTHDQEKAALIMQVLQLSDEQIAMLPMDQRQSILILKEQIARSANQGDV